MISSLFPCSIKVGCLAVVRIRQLIVKYVTIISTVSNIQSRALPMHQMLLRLRGMWPLNACFRMKTPCAWPGLAQVLLALYIK